MPLSSDVCGENTSPMQRAKGEAFSSPLFMLLDRGGFSSKRACAGESDGPGPKEDLANRWGERERERGRVRSRAVWTFHRPLLLPVDSSWPINIFKDGLKPAWLNFLLALILSSSRSRATPTLSRAHAAQLLAWCSSYWTGWCKWCCTSAFLGWRMELFSSNVIRPEFLGL